MRVEAVSEIPSARLGKGISKYLKYLREVFEPITTEKVMLEVKAGKRTVVDKQGVSKDVDEDIGTIYRGLLDQVKRNGKEFKGVSVLFRSKRCFIVRGYDEKVIGKRGK